MVAGVDHGLRWLDLEVEPWICGPAATEKKGIRSSEHSAIEFNILFFYRIIFNILFFIFKIHSN
jgi:hypothetical protein